MLKKIGVSVATILAFLACGILLGVQLKQIEISIFPIIICLALIFAGAFVFTYLHIILHEFGHLRGGLKNGYKFVSFTIGALKIYKVNEKLKISFQRNAKYGGFCQMVPSNTDNIEKSIKKMIMGGINASIIFTIISLVLTILPLFFDVNVYFYCLICANFPISLYILLNNTVFNEATGAMTDGGYIKTIKDGTATSKVLLRILTIQAMFTSGIRPKDVPYNVFTDIPTLRASDPMYFVAYSNLMPILLDKGEIESAIEYTKEAYSNIKHCLDIYREMILSEVFFVKIFYQYKKTEATEIYSEIEEFLLKTPELSSYMCQIAKAIYIDKDRVKAEELKAQAEEIKDLGDFKGVNDYEFETILSMFE